MKINTVRKSLQKQYDNLDTISEKLADIMEEIEDDELCDRIDKICEAIDEILNGDNPRTSFPDVFEYIDNELIDNED
jgi:uncharacterized membrane protein